jgi:molybdopterin molybdotransferase
MISLQQAHAHIYDLSPLPPVSLPLGDTLGLVCSDNIFARINCPSVDASLKDGFAVISSDIADATPKKPVLLAVHGSIMAGDENSLQPLESGQAIRIMTGAQIPPGATAVLASEFSHQKEKIVFAHADAQPGRNILYQGSDIKKGQQVVAKKTFLEPAHLGLLAAAGVSSVYCYQRPQVAIVATGSELVLPGESVTPGKISASNMITLAAALQKNGIVASTILIRDQLNSLQEQFARLADQVDLLITCGGVLDGDKDLTLQAMEAIGMTKIFHRVRIGPGKGACMGMVGKTVVFNLPGGPPSNHVAFLLLALPGLRRLMGYEECFPTQTDVVVRSELKGQDDWTQLVYARVAYQNTTLSAKPLLHSKRLAVMAQANALIEIPEGCSRIATDEQATAWIFGNIS